MGIPTRYSQFKDVSQLSPSSRVIYFSWPELQPWVDGMKSGSVQRAPTWVLQKRSCVCVCGLVLHTDIYTCSNMPLAPPKLVGFNHFYYCVGIEKSYNYHEQKPTVSRDWNWEPIGQRESGLWFMQNNGDLHSWGGPEVDLFCRTMGRDGAVSAVNWDWTKHLLTTLRRCHGYKAAYL